MNLWSNLQNLGHFGFYVWSAYAVTFAMLLGSFLLALRRHRILRYKLANRHQQSTH